MYQFRQAVIDHFGDLIKVKGGEAMVGSDTDLDYMDRAARHFAGMAQLKCEDEPCSELDPIISKVYIGPRSARTFADGSHFQNGSNMTAEILLHESGGKTVNYLECIRPASYPPVPQIKQPETMTATEAIQAQKLNEASLEQLLIDLSCIYPGGAKIRMSRAELEAQLAMYQAAKDWQEGHNVESRLQATIKAKDEIIAKLQADNARLNQALWGALDIDGSVISQNKELTAENEAYKSAAKHWRKIAEERADEIGLRNAALSLMAEHKRELEAYAKTLEATIAELNRQLGNEPKPSTRDISRLGHFGESHARNGLSLFDRYY